MGSSSSDGADPGPGEVTPASATPAVPHDAHALIADLRKRLDQLESLVEGPPPKG
jgi:hypothetical protein